MGSGQTIQVDVRVVAATNQDLSTLVANRQFRADLYFRLNVTPMNLPPLRKRVQDIPLLVKYFLWKSSSRLNRSIDSIPSEVMEVLKARDWPGNIRELRNFIERAGVFARLGIALAANTLETDYEADDEAAARGGLPHARGRRAGAHSGSY